MSWRAPEVGIRRALGATRKVIQRLFMLEAFTISACGGLLGVVFRLDTSG